MAAITVQEIPVGGLASVTFAAANGGGDTIAGGSKRLAGYAQHEVVLIARNAHTATQDVTVAGLAAVTVPANTGTAVIPIPDEGLNDASVGVTYSGVTALTVAVVRVGGSY